VCKTGVLTSHTHTATLDFLDRLGNDLDLETQQTLFFQYKMNALDFSDHGMWRAYSLPEQLQIFSKLALAYLRKDSPVSGGVVLFLVFRH
jgi:hypothetical protein